MTIEHQLFYNDAVLGGSTESQVYVPLYRDTSLIDCWGYSLEFPPSPRQLLSVILTFEVVFLSFSTAIFRIENESCGTRSFQLTSIFIVSKDVPKLILITAGFWRLCFTIERAVLGIFFSRLKTFLEPFPFIFLFPGLNFRADETVVATFYGDIGGLLVRSVTTKIYLSLWRLRIFQTENRIM